MSTSSSPIANATLTLFSTPGRPGGQAYRHGQGTPASEGNEDEASPASSIGAHRRVPATSANPSPSATTQQTQVVPNAWRNLARHWPPSEDGESDDGEEATTREDQQRVRRPAQSLSSGRASADIDIGSSEPSQVPEMAVSGTGQEGDQESRRKRAHRRRQALARADRASLRRARANILLDARPDDEPAVEDV